MNLIDFFKSFPWKKTTTMPKKLPLVKLGSTDKYYLDLIHKQLIASGTSPQALSNDISSGEFGQQTKNAVVYFQQTHLGPDKQNLDIDGIVGSDTWWALYNNNGEAQKLNLKAEIVNLTGNRQKVLNIAKAEHQKGVAEVPLGSNYGDGVTKYLKYVGIGPNPWCLASLMWIVSQALGKLPFPKGAHCSTFWNQCKKLGIAHNVGAYSPIPGDIFVIVHNDDTGHVGLVSSVDSATNCIKFNSYEGNSANRFALRQRDIYTKDLKGFVNFYGDASNRPKFNVGLSTSSSNDDLDKTR